MADNIVQGLFGMTPESYQQNLNEQAQAEALRFAQLDPFQRANYGIFLGGRQLGNAIGGALGAQDPQLQMVTRTQSLLRGIDPSDEASLAQGIKAASAFNPQLAVSLSGELQKLQKSKAESYKAYKEAQSTEQRNAGALADASGASRGSEEWQNEYKKQLERLTIKKPGESMLKAQAIVDARAAVRNSPEGSPERAQAEDMLRALQMDKLQLTTIGVEGNPQLVQTAFVDPYNPGAKPITVGAPMDRYTAKTNFSPEIQMTSKELGWREQYLKENKTVIDQGAGVRQSLSLLQQSQTSPFADAAFANTVVSAFGGDKQKSKSEIDRLVKAGSLDERIANTLTGFFEGTTSAKTKADQLKVLQAVDKALEARYNSSAKGWSTRLNKAKVDADLVVPSYSEVVGANPTPAVSFIEGAVYKNKKTGKNERFVNGKFVPVAE